MKSHIASVWLSFSWMAHSERSQSPCFENTHTALWRGLCEEQISVCVCVCVHAHALSLSVVSDSVTPWTVANRLLCLWDSPGKNTGLGCHFLLQGIFPTQELNPCLLHWQVDSSPLSHLGNSSPADS